MSVNEKMTAIASAIRSKTGKTEVLTLDGMASGIGEVYNKGVEAGQEGRVILPELSNPATAADVLENKEVIDGDGNKVTGTMPHVGMWDFTLTPENAPDNNVHIVVPKGYHDGNGRVQADVFAFEDRAKDVVERQWWENYQNSGNRISYDYAFAGTGWNENTFRPRHDINASKTLSSIFRASGIADLKGILAAQGVKLNITSASIDYFATGSALTRCPEVGAALTNIGNAFNGCTSLVSIDKVNMSTTAACNCSLGFRNCTKLEEIRFNAGIRPTSLTLEFSKSLSKASLASNNEDGKGYGLIPALADGVTGSVTVSNAAVTASFTETEWTALCNTKPTWTITRA